MTVPMARLDTLLPPDTPIHFIKIDVEGHEYPALRGGEVVVQGPWVTRQYFNLEDATRLAKIRDGENFWHRMGDLGWFDKEQRLWFCGRKSHALHTRLGLRPPVPTENVFNTHPRVHRTALERGRGFASRQGGFDRAKHFHCAAQATTGAQRQHRWLVHDVFAFLVAENRV